MLLNLLPSRLKSKVALTYLFLLSKNDNKKLQLLCQDFKNKIKI